MSDKARDLVIRGTRNQQIVTYYVPTQSDALNGEGMYLGNLLK